MKEDTVALSSEELRNAAKEILPKLGNNEEVMDAIYDTPFEAHARMEPMNSLRARTV